MPEPTLDNHEIEFRKWWKGQGDTSPLSLFVVAKRAYFAGAAYGSRCILKVYNDTVAEVKGSKDEGS